MQILVGKWPLLTRLLKARYGSGIVTSPNSVKARYGSGIVTSPNSVKARYGSGIVTSPNSVKARYGSGTVTSPNSVNIWHTASSLAEMMGTWKISVHLHKFMGQLPTIQFDLWCIDYNRYSEKTKWDKSIPFGNICSWKLVTYDTCFEFLMSKKKICVVSSPSAGVTSGVTASGTTAPGATPPGAASVHSSVATSGGVFGLLLWKTWAFGLRPAAFDGVTWKRKTRSTSRSTARQTRNSEEEPTSVKWHCYRSKHRLMVKALMVHF